MQEYQDQGSADQPQQEQPEGPVNPVLDTPQGSDREETSQPEPAQSGQGNVPLANKARENEPEVKDEQGGTTPPGTGVTGGAGGPAGVAPGVAGAPGAAGDAGV